jgi:hypothetical protein
MTRFIYVLKEIRACLEAELLEHDPEKWTPVFRKDHAQIKEIERDDDSKKSHRALADVQQRLAVLSRDMDNHNGQRIPHQPAFSRS